MRTTNGKLRIAAVRDASEIMHGHLAFVIMKED